MSHITGPGGEIWTVDEFLEIQAKRIKVLELQLRIWNNWANRFPLRSYSRCLFGFSSEAVTASNAKVIGQWLTSLWDIVRASIALVPDETPAAETKGEKS